MASLPNDKNSDYYRVIFRNTIKGEKYHKTFWFKKKEYSRSEVEQWKEHYEELMKKGEWTPYDELTVDTTTLDNLKGEEWKEIKGYEGLYEVSSKGRIKTLHDGIPKILRQTEHDSGYLYVNLSKNAKFKRKFVHRLVGEAFLEEDKDRDFINHMDRDKKNNKLENLEWVTNSENVAHGYFLSRLENATEVAKFIYDAAYQGEDKPLKISAHM